MFGPMMVDVEKQCRIRSSVTAYAFFIFSRVLWLAENLAYKETAIRWVGTCVEVCSS